MKKITLFLICFFVIVSYTFAQDTHFEEIKISQNIITNNTINFESEYKALIDIHIYNILGQVVLEEIIDIKNEKNIDISEIPYGVYLLQIKSGYESKILKFIKK